MIQAMFSNLIFKKMLAAFFDARKSVKKSISEKTGKNIVMEDDENIFEHLKDM